MRRCPLQISRLRLYQQAAPASSPVLLTQRARPLPVLRNSRRVHSRCQCVCASLDGSAGCLAPWHGTWDAAGTTAEAAAMQVSVSVHRRHVGDSAILILLHAMGQAVVLLHHPAGSHHGTLGAAQAQQLKDLEMAFPAAATAAQRMHLRRQQQPHSWVSKRGHAQLLGSSAAHATWGAR